MAAQRDLMSGALLPVRVMHRRLQPRRQAFHYRGFQLCFALDQQADLERILGRFNPLGFRTADHGPRDGSPLEPWIRQIFGQAGIQPHRIMLVAYPRLWGYAFKPVSFWLGLNQEGALLAVLAEVNNTFGEHHSYVIAHPDGHPIDPQDWFEREKLFHVSPFFSTQGRYRFRFRLDAEAFQADIHYLDDHGAPLLITQLAGLRQKLSVGSAWRATLGHPLMTAMVTVGIHWEALKLWRVRIPFHSKPQPPAEEISS